MGFGQGTSPLGHEEHQATPPPPWDCGEGSATGKTPITPFAGVGNPIRRRNQWLEPFLMMPRPFPVRISSHRKGVNDAG